MPLFEKLDPEVATGDVGAIFADIKSTLRITFIPNFFQTLAYNAPNVLRGTWEAYKNVNWLGALPPAIKEMIFTAVSNAKECRYCEAAHLAFCTALSVDMDSLYALGGDLDGINPPKIRAIVKFGVDCAFDPTAIGADRHRELRDHGLTTGEILETIAMVSFALYAINLADAMRLDIDEDFKQILRQGIPGWVEPPTQGA